MELLFIDKRKTVEQVLGGKIRSSVLCIYIEFQMCVRHLSRDNDIYL